MNRSLICYHGGWFAELDWLRRLLDWPMADCAIDETQSLVLENSIVLCADLAGLRPELLARIRQTKGVVLFHISDEWYRQPVQVYENFAHVVRNYHYGCLRHPAITTLPLGPCRDVREKLVASPLSQRRHIWSFAGQVTATRAAMMECLRPLQPHCLRTTAGVKTAQPLLEAEAYKEMLHDSIFVPCPMGNVNLESFRLYEALDAGAIPIVERRPWLDYYTRLLGPHPLPTVNHWHEAPGLMQSLLRDAVAMGRKQHEIREWWHAYEAGLRTLLTGLLASCFNSTARPLSGVNWPGRARGFWEMLKHHNRIALAQRLRTLARRRLR